MKNRFMLWLGYIPIKIVEREIDKLSHEIDMTTPIIKWNDKTQNTKFFLERDWKNKFMKHLYNLKIDLKYYDFRKEKTQNRQTTPLG